MLKTRPRLRQAVFALAALGLGGGAMAAMIATKAEPEPSAVEERVWPVSAVTLARETLTPEIVVFGQVVAGRAAELRPLVAGPIVAVSDQLQEGGFAPAGAELLRIDPFEYEIALEEQEAAEREAAARHDELLGQVESERELIAVDEKQVTLRQRDYNRRLNLRQRGAGTQSAVDEAELGLAQAQQALIQRRQSIARLEAQIDQQIAAVERAAASARRARRDLADATLSAPFDGVLTGVQDIAVGKRVGVGDPIARLIDTNALEARVQIPDADFARLLGAEIDANLLIGAPAMVRWRIGGEGYRYAARIARIGAEVDPASGGVDVFLEIDGGADGALRPGAFVEAVFQDRPLEDVFVVPADALSDEGVLHLINAEQRLEAVPVSILRRFDGQAAIAGDLPEGGRAVARRFPEIGPGLKVKIP